MELGKRIRKVTCRVGTCGGFIANRMVDVSGAGLLMNDGVLPRTIAEASEGYGMKMGPRSINDWVGLDFCGRERATRARRCPTRSSWMPCTLPGASGRRMARASQVRREAPHAR